ncbi:MAG TPA: HEAT repeat domain-containing protein [Anaeromyxobacteraceae bacterium]|nr:HEAT repeat domain-containing protein [Anaeromyxobacteraceae bacterium]
MGLFGLFASKEEREKNALRKLGRKITEKYGPPENRQKAIEQLGDLRTDAALRTLLLRFTVRVDPGITDEQEKDTVRRLVVGAGDLAVAPIESFLREREEGVAWGLRALAEIAPDRVLPLVVAELARLGREYTRDPEKKLTLLAWLREHHAGETAPEVEEALLPLLEDFSDDVRIGATRVLAARPPSERAREGLIALLLRDRDNPRVRGEVLAALAGLGVDVKGHRPSVEALLVDPWYLDKEGHVKKRG